MGFIIMSVPSERGSKVQRSKVQGLNNGRNRQMSEHRGQQPESAAKGMNPEN
jgi:hypothetical protein